MFVKQEDRSKSEHLRDFRYGNRKYKFAMHLLYNRHSIGPMEKVMETLHITNKGRVMDTLERFYILWEIKLNNQITDKLTVKPNIVFKTIVQRDPHIGLPNARISQSVTLSSVLYALYKRSYGKNSATEQHLEVSRLTSQ